MDPRLQNLSYSSLLTLHSCPRKYQLYKLNTEVKDVEDSNQSLTFLFGHLVGEGIQQSLQGISEDQILWNMFLAWDMDLFLENSKQNKSFWACLFAIQAFQYSILNSYLSDYELVYYEGKPAVELSFVIYLPGGYKYRGFVDAVLRNKFNGEILVLEVKTSSSSSLYPAQYQNSSQAVGYSIVLDHIFKDLSSYKVLYLPYKTKDMVFEPLPFTKSFLQRALWIQEILLDTQAITAYDTIGIFPMHGESCYNWYRECEYFGTCTLATERLVKPITLEQEQKLDEDLKEFQIHVTFDDLIAAQLEKMEG